MRKIDVTLLADLKDRALNNQCSHHIEACQLICRAIKANIAEKSSGTGVFQ